MDEPNDATPFLPEKHTLNALREAAAGCHGCHLWRGAAQTVFGEGLKRARLMFVGEQPGDKEDLAGKPFVGPAGRELDEGLEAAGIARRGLRDQRSDLAPLVTATIHPSAILRRQDDASRSKEREAFAEDLRVVAKALSG